MLLRNENENKPKRFFGVFLTELNLVQRINISKKLMGLPINYRANSSIFFLLVSSFKVTRPCLELILERFTRALSLLFAHPSIEHFSPWGASRFSAAAEAAAEAEAGAGAPSDRLFSRNRANLKSMFTPPDPPHRGVERSSTPVSQIHHQHVRLFAKQEFVDQRH